MTDDRSRQSAPVLTSAAGSPRSSQSDGAATPVAVPWATAYRQDPNGMYAQEVFDAELRTIATFAWYRVETPDGYTTNREANAEFVIRAVNSHAELLAALKAMEDAAMRLGLSRGEDDDKKWADALLAQFAALNMARAAIARAEGRS